MKMDVIEQFKNCELLIDIYNASLEDMTRLDGILNLKWRSGARLHELMNYTQIVPKRFLKYQMAEDVIGYTITSDDIQVMTVREFIENCEHPCKPIDDEEFENMFKE